MTLKNQPFQRTQDIQKYDTLTIRLNPDEWKELKACMKVLRQPKPGTAAKTLMRLAAFVLHRDNMGLVFQEIIENTRKNKRTGITEYD